MWKRSALRIAAAAGAALAVFYLVVLPYRANREIVAIEQRTLGAQTLEAMAAAPLARANLTDLAHIELAERLDPSWYLLYGANCEIVGQRAEAAAIYSRALRIDQRPEIYFKRGLVMMQLGRMDAAVSDLATAARFNPYVLYDLDGDLRSRVTAAAAVR
jgi:tetratricopeptide (TPR) repeat protein